MARHKYLVGIHGRCSDNVKEGSLSTEELIEKMQGANLADMRQSSVLVYGDFQESHEALIRMHSICHTGDIFEANVATAVFN